MAYKCLRCKNIFEEGEEAHYNENDEYWGMLFSYDMTCCPICKGDYEPTVQCSICGGDCLKRELFGGVCKSCIDEYRHDYKMCSKISCDCKEEIKINSLLACIFEPVEIEQILEEYIINKCKDVDCSKFIDYDLSWFGSMLAKEVSDNENQKDEQG